MFESLYRFSLFALYQFAVVVGILLLPLALVARRAGLPFPVGRLVETLGTAYENASSR
ncbi:hypothetical protein [Halegenticoccus soli]|uniref:hypothetical protein n=1 Tax=Halegenticoccus soli TaxID=1985678 RepID=UPI0018EA5930|nr:hypothetical protein [Halegenticoccus soli]